MTWTKEDEAKLQALLETKQLAQSLMRDCVVRAVAQFHYRSMDEGELTDALIEQATTIRKVLEPFDKEA